MKLGMALTLALLVALFTEKGLAASTTPTPKTTAPTTAGATLKPVTDGPSTSAGAGATLKPVTSGPSTSAGAGAITQSAGGGAGKGKGNDAASMHGNVFMVATIGAIVSILKTL